MFAVGADGSSFKIYSRKGFMRPPGSEAVHVPGCELLSSMDFLDLVGRSPLYLPLLLSFEDDLAADFS